MGVSKITNPDQAMQEAGASLREAGLWVTAPRSAVLAWLTGHPHATVEHIRAGVREQYQRVSVQALYDVLAACADAGLVRCIEPAGHAARYERRTGDNHHHLVCRHCGAVADVDCTVGARPCLTPSDDLGFAVDEAEVVFWGLCTDCQTEPDTPPGSSLPRQS